MTQTVRLTITPDLENALQILHRSTMGTLNTTELIKMAIGGFAQLKETDMTQKIDNIAHPEKLKPYTPKKLKWPQM